MPGQKTDAVFNRQIRSDWDSFKVAGSVDSIIPILALEVFHAARVSQPNASPPPPRILAK
ncbi:hypothetical protein [Rubripirellula obstinata]|uniref:hypothetical protein n=1 Tax=Rubripirellula obstinata TaxID=406547 RepID=UPI00082BF148|nr:hypothetical protein [Rubripirellula obstinata]